MKITQRDKLFVILIISILCFWCEYKVVLSPIQKNIAELTVKKDEAKSLLTDTTPLEKKADKVKERKNKLFDRIEDIKSTYSEKTIKKEDFLVFIGNSTVRNNVKVTKYNNLGIGEENGVYKMIVDMELKGDAKNINNVLTEIDKLGIKYSIGSFSFRQNEEYDYLKRFYDNYTELPWYKEPEKEEKEVKEDEAENDEDIPDSENDKDSAETTVPQQQQLPPEPIEQPPISELPKEEPKSIEQRLDDLLELTVAKKGVGNNRLILLGKKENAYGNGLEMRLAFTICIVMFDEQSGGNAAVYNTENSNGIL